MGLRRSIPTFELANPIYVGAVVYFYTVDDSGAKTTTLATLYDSPAGTGTLSNPQTLDSEGKFSAPVYIESPVIASVTGLTVDDHDTGIISVPGKNRGAWATETIYYAGEITVAGTDADSTQDVYAVDYTHTSDVFADDVAAGYLSKLIDVSALADLFDVPDPGGSALKFLRVKSDGTAYEFLTAAAVLAAIGALAVANDLSDVNDAATARSNLSVSSASEVAAAILAKNYYDIPFTAGFDSTMTKEDVSAATYGEMVASRTGSFTGEAGYADTAPTGQALIVDIEKNGTTIYTTNPQFAAGANALTSGTLKTDGTEDFVSGDRITFKVTQVGSGDAGQGVRFTAKGLAS